MGTNDKVGTALFSPNDSANSVVKPSCATSDDKGIKRDTCHPDSNDASPAEIAETTKRVKRDEDTPRAYLLSTIDGINRAQYEEWAKKPPLGDKEGDIIAFDELEYVSCQYLNLTDAEAAIVRQDPIIRFIEPITEDDGELRVIPPQEDPSSLLPSSLHVKAQALNQRDESAAHLKLLSARNQRNDPTKLPNYVFEPSLGKGQTIYVLDSGYRKSHQEFDASEREVRDFTVANRYTFAGIGLTPDQQGPEDMTDVTGHGTMVASIAAGYVSGVASKANLVVVKMRNWAKNPLNPDRPELKPRGVTDSALEYALAWTRKDIRQQKLENPDPNARYIINLSYGWDIEQHPGKIAVLEYALAECKKDGVTLVIAAGNDGEHRTLDSLIPQTYGTDNRFEMITVGGVDQTGKYYAHTVQGKEGQGGQVDVYADAVQVVAAKHNDKDDSTAPVDGTSAAAPAIAGLAAYLFSIPGLSSNWGDDTAPADMKKFMLKNSEVRNDNPFKEGEEYPTSPKPDKDSLKVPYNLAQNTLCDLPDAAAKRSLFTKRAPTPEKSVPGRPIIENGEVTNEDLKNEICNVHNRPASDTEPKPEPAPEAPAPLPNTAACKVLEQGLGGGKWEVTGSGWGDEASLKKKFGEDSFNYTGGDSFTATFVSVMSTDEIENAVREMSGLGDVTCT
ncbi:hypothetical protein J4E93_000748 [Alternaria ventricosa]|uniref:uncharacterized protein n=1 Tax=Alternaria ventricosa TaxID=1187951 RepID=UPI0020C56F8A|nr:uncharacterized protein J4E93_000748 [Alternaria ventricosa]KAI4656032.1 hypothetical protein J4E93_000748 [Alternaria ventricosa]